MPPQRAGSLLNQSNYQDAASILNQLVDGRHSPIQLAAISNYKLAQLTFAPPDIHSLRKTAVIKNTAQYIYDITPKEWLDEMTRWEFFTLEALDDIDMTQEGLETILSEYVQIMDSFKTANFEANVDLNSITFDEDNTDDWILSQQQQQLNETKTPERSSSGSSSNSTTTTKSYITTASSISSAPLPTPPTRQDIVEQHRKSFRLNQHRISWTSDTGLPSFAASQHLAGELMSLFDMEFKVDISLDPYSTPAPQLPELSYFQEKQKHRSSVDSFMCLIPAFESFQIDSHDGLSFVSKANRRTSSLIGPGSGVGNGISSSKRISSSLAPARSSSLKYKNGHLQSSSKNDPSPNRYDYSTLPPPDNDDSQDRVPLTKKKSIRKLVSLFGKKRLNSETALPLDHHQLSAMPLASMSSPALTPSNLAGHTVPTYNAITPSALTISSSTTGIISSKAPAPPTESSHRTATSPTEPSLASSPTSRLTTSKDDVVSRTTNVSSTSTSTASTVTTRAQRRRSNSVPGISTSFIAELYNQQDRYNDDINQSLQLQRNDTANSHQPQNQSTNLYPSSLTNTKSTTGNNGDGTDKRQISQSVSSYELGSFGRLERKQSLSHSPTSPSAHHRQPYYQQPYYQQQVHQNHQHQPQMHQNQHYSHPRQELRQYHSTHDLSQMYSGEPNNNSNSTNGSKDSMALSSASPTSPKKSSSFLQRMTTFARRKKHANNTANPPSPVPV